jgi:hypothetical protein
MPCPDIHDYTLAQHAQWAMTRRGISEAQVDRVLKRPEQSEVIEAGRCVYQSRITPRDSSGTYLLRVFVGIDYDPPHVVTVYRTSKAQKYWR